VNQASSYPHGFQVETRDFDQAASLLHDSAVPYVAELLPDSPAFSTNIFVIGSPRIRVSRVLTKGHMMVKSCMPAEAFALVLDIGGSGLGLHRIGRRTISVDSENGFLQSPLQPVEVHTTPNYEALFLRISRTVIVSELERMLGREIHTGLVFSPAIRLHSVAGRSLRALSTELRRTVCDTDHSSVDTSMPVRKIENDIVTLLLQSQSHNYTRLLNRQSAAGNYQIDTAEQFMRANAQIAVSLGDVCQAAGVNARTLQHSFRRRRGCTPMEFLRKIRMEEVRSRLQQPTQETSVSGEAARWGFLHFGRFSGEYRRVYGELPSETLRRAKNRL
jgi:AraC-like DNA-binding protein